MCLNVVKPLPENPEHISGEGYKVLMPRTGFPAAYYGPIMTAPCMRYEPGVEVHAYEEGTPPPMAARGFMAYPAGFHIFEQEKHAWGYLSDFLRPQDYYMFQDAQVWRVGYRHLLACGKTYWSNSDIQCLDWAAPTLVTKYMTLLEECKRAR